MGFSWKRSLIGKAVNGVGDAGDWIYNKPVAGIVHGVEGFGQAVVGDTGPAQYGAPAPAPAVGVDPARMARGSATGAPTPASGMPHPQAPVDPRSPYEHLVPNAPHLSMSTPDEMRQSYAQSIAAQYTPQIRAARRQAQFDRAQGDAAAADIGNWYGQAGHSIDHQAHATQRDAGHAQHMFARTAKVLSGLPGSESARAVNGARSLIDASANSQMSHADAGYLHRLGAATAAEGAYQRANVRNKFINDAAEIQAKISDLRAARGQAIGSSQLQADQALNQLRQQNYDNHRQHAQDIVGLRQQYNDPGAVADAKAQAIDLITNHNQDRATALATIGDTLNPAQRQQLQDYLATIRPWLVSTQHQNNAMVNAQAQAKKG